MAAEVTFSNRIGNNYLNCFPPTPVSIGLRIILQQYVIWGFDKNLLEILLKFFCNGEYINVEMCFEYVELIKIKESRFK